MEQKTNDEYIANPNSCPFCESENVSWNTEEIFDGDSIYKNNECNVCKKEWADIYMLTSYEEASNGAMD